MADTNTRPKPWLIAAWPGMGNVAVIGAGYLVQSLRMETEGELPSRGHFDIAEVEVKDGVVVPPRLPRGRFFRRPGRGGERDVIVFIGESQPATGTYKYAHELLAKATEMGVERIVTFASMASGLHPSEDPKVSGVATSGTLLEELGHVGVGPLEDGQIGGLNGVLLGAAADRGMEGVCLLGEIPYFAAAVPNPKAARAVLSVFSILAGLDVKLDALSQYAEAMDRAILEAMQKLEEDDEGEAEVKLPEEPDGGPPKPEPGAPEPAASGAGPGPGAAKKIDYATRSRIERMFQEAREDRTKAVRLKEELDRLGVYAAYEDRFLDLFRRAE